MDLSPEVLIYVQSVKNYFATNKEASEYFLSGSNAQLNTSLPIKYRSNGLSLFYKKNGGLDYLKIMKSMCHCFSRSFGTGGITKNIPNHL